MQMTANVTVFVDMRNLSSAGHGKRLDRSFQTQLHRVSLTAIGKQVLCQRLSVTKRPQPCKIGAPGGATLQKLQAAFPQQGVFTVNAQASVFKSPQKPVAWGLLDTTPS